MKKTILLSVMAIAAICSCQKKELISSAPASEYEISVAVSLDDATKTAFVPEGNKVIWLSGDKVAAKYTKTEATKAKNDNVSLTLDSGANSGCAKFKGKLGSTNAVPDGNAFVFYYPPVSTVSKSGSVVSADDFTLGGNFPRIQNSGDVNFEANLMYGVAANSEWLTTTESVCNLEVAMKNVMSVLDFTIKGEGSVKRIFVTDLNPSAKAMQGEYTVKITSGNFDSFTALPDAKGEYDRTITAEFPKPIALTADGTHVYVTVQPRTYSSGIRVGIEMTDGKFMVKTISSSFTTVSNNVYTVPELVFTDQSADGKILVEGNVVEYKTFTDSRDGNVYRYVTLADGRDWMIDNLRYLPEGITAGKTVSEVNAGVWYPVIMNAAGTALAFGVEADIAKYGYLYNCSVAIGQDPDYMYEMAKAILAGTLTEAAGLEDIKTNINSAAICPEGWHIPSDTEYNTLYSAYGSNVSALGFAGFSFRDVGYLNITNPTASSDPSSGSFSGFTSGKFNMTYIILATPNSSKQFKAVMFNGTNSTAAVNNMNCRSGAIVRCVRNAEK